DGSTMAVVHEVSGKDQLEYPIGHMLLETTGYFSDLRVSPDGSGVAFFDHAIPNDDRGYIKVVDRAGHVTTVSEEYSGLEGLTWMPGGHALGFAASDAGRDFQPLMVDISGRAQATSTFSTPGNIIVHDATPDGRLLVDRFIGQRGVRGIAPGD